MSNTDAEELGVKDVPGWCIGRCHIAGYLIHIRDNYETQTGYQLARGRCVKRMKRNSHERATTMYKATNINPSI